MSSSFIDKLKAKWDEGKFVCVGLDSDYDKLPESVKQISKRDSIFQFNKAIIDATADLVCAYKPNIAFYEAIGAEGIEALEDTNKYIQEKYPAIPIILDGKRGDVGSTNEGYINISFQILSADAITVHPYLGMVSAQPFLDQKDKGVFVLVKTSNPGSGEFQNLEVEGKPLYQILAKNIVEKWNVNGNCGVVAGATYPEELKKIRDIVGDMPILIPGIGAQGGDLEATIKAGKDSKNQGMIINSSRAIIFASSGEDFAEAARIETEKLHNQIKENILQ